MRNNECGECEICVGKPTVPDHCFGDDEPHDAGLTVQADQQPMQGPDTGAPPPAEERCPEGVQPCGLPGDFGAQIRDIVSLVLSSCALKGRGQA